MLKGLLIPGNCQCKSLEKVIYLEQHMKKMDSNTIVTPKMRMRKLDQVISPRAVVDRNFPVRISMVWVLNNLNPVLLHLV